VTFPLRHCEPKARQSRCWGLLRHHAVPRNDISALSLRAEGVAISSHCLGIASAYCLAMTGKGGAPRNDRKKSGASQ